MSFRTRLATLGFVQSMNRPREVTDNAHMESFFHSLKADVIHGRSFQTVTELRQQLRRLGDVVRVEKGKKVRDVTVNAASIPTGIAIDGRIHASS